MFNRTNHIKRRAASSAGLHMLSECGNYSATLQTNLAEAHCILHETDSRRLFRGNAFRLAAEATRRLKSDLPSTKAQATTSFHTESAAKLEKLLRQARRNVMSHMSDRNAQAMFILLSRFLGVPAELEAVYAQDHSAKIKSAGTALRLGTSAIPFAGGVVGILAKTTMDVQAQKHASSVRHANKPQFHDDVVTIGKTPPQTSAGGVKGVADVVPAKLLAGAWQPQQPREEQVPPQKPQQQMYYRDEQGNFVPAPVPATHSATAPPRGVIPAPEDGAKDSQEEGSDDKEDVRRAGALREYQVARARLLANIVLKAREKQVRGLREEKDLTASS